MTIAAWVGFGLISALVLFLAVAFAIDEQNWKRGTIVIVIAIVIIAALFFGMRWYFTNTASGQRALVDQQSNLANGMERTITVYTADGHVLARYSGRIDLEANNGGYTKFDFEGKRYIYYNCFVESIANID